MKTAIFLIGFTVLMVSQCNGSADEKRLISDLLQDYNPLARPVENSSQPVTVKAGLVLLTIEMSQRSRYEMEAGLWHKVGWTDVYLNWDPKEYGGIKSIRLPISKVWVPDLAIFNSVPLAFDLRSVNSFYVVVDSSGYVNWIPPTPVKVLCEGEEDSESQICVEKLGSWTYSGMDLDLQLDAHPLDASEYKKNPCWDLKDTKAARNVKFYECCPEPYIDLTFKFTLSKTC